jgi:hypothetical protein
MKSCLFPAIVLATCASTIAQTSDTPAVDLNQLLQGLRQFKEQNEVSVKTRRNAAYQQVVAAAASNEKAAVFWAESVLQVQFAGVDHQTTAVRDWKQGEGEALRTKEVANAARLNLVWLGLTIQHSAGAETKQLLNNIIDFTKQVEADEMMIGKVADQIDKAKERAGGAKKANANKTIAEETHAKRTHDSIMRMSVANSPVARRLQITDLLGDLGGKKKKGDEGAGDGGGWEPVPGNVNGIYNSIILPEFRANKDPRLLEYWDTTIKKAQQNIDPGMADYDERQWTQVRQPRLLWSRAQDVFLIGQKNRAVTEMFNLIKTYPQHPDNAAWISRLESMLAPQAPASPAAGTSVAPPLAVPTATIVPPPAAGTPPAPAPR